MKLSAPISVLKREAKVLSRKKSDLMLLGARPGHGKTRFELDDSDDVCADRIIRRLGSAPPGAVVVVDYLQILDHKRENPALADVRLPNPLDLTLFQKACFINDGRMSFATIG